MKKLSLLSQFDVICIIPLWIGNNEISPQKLSLVFVVLIGIVVFYWLYSNQVVPRSWQVMFKSIFKDFKFQSLVLKFRVLELKFKSLFIFFWLYKKGMFKIDRVHFLPLLVWVESLFLIWYGFIVCWILPIYYRSSRRRVLLKKGSSRFISQKKFYNDLNSLLLNFNITLNLFVNKIWFRRSYCIFNSSKRDDKYMYGSIKISAQKTAKKHPTIENFVEDIDNGDIFFVKVTTTTCDKNVGPLVLKDFYGRPAYLFNGKKGLFMMKIKTIEDLNSVKDLINDYKVDLINGKILNSNVTKEIIQSFVINKIKLRKNINVKYINENMNTIEDREVVLNEMENRIKNDFIGIEKKID